jgi:hypothetical protein
MDNDECRKEGLIGILMTQFMYRPAWEFIVLTYQALVD